MHGGVEDVDDDDDDSFGGGFDEDLGWEQDQLNKNDNFPLISRLNLPFLAAQLKPQRRVCRISVAPIKTTC